MRNFIAIVLKLILALVSALAPYAVALMFVFVFFVLVLIGAVFMHVFNPPPKIDGVTQWSAVNAISAMGFAVGGCVLLWPVLGFRTLAERLSRWKIRLLEKLDRLQAG